MNISSILSNADSESHQDVKYRVQQNFPLKSSSFMILMMMTPIHQPHQYSFIMYNHPFSSASEKCKISFFSTNLFAYNDKFGVLLKNDWQRVSYVWLNAISFFKASVKPQEWNWDIALNLLQHNIDIGLSSNWLLACFLFNHTIFIKMV